MNEVNYGYFNSNVKDYLTTETPNLVIGLQETSQVQQSFGKIISKHPIADVELVSTHYHANAITAQIQESFGSISTHHFVDANNMVSVKASTYQQQGISGAIITNNDDNDMMMVLLALMALDDDVA